ncbi:Transcription antitermination factor NusG [Mucilaginibacter pineti]|uniref:Transcription antitermination factor NusG n=1 Tax=Mucilaginibacter pineti TaxID=1391627 RepID=A0A1G6XFN2_9SPHI|nr:UpxY family transcription antiterminator [Mucilaginibacter pineti]SDD76613.1 Transcription antitermination factor NusG [Mucilaginibacter pineti]
METQLSASAVRMANYREKKWLVLYTKPRWEKKVDRLLKQHDIESYCPVREVVNQWSDRKKEISVPLFSSYVFVHVDVYEQSRALYILGVLGFVYYMGKPAVVRDNVIEEIRTYLINYRDIEIVSMCNINIGDTVKIKEGPLVNQMGKVLQIQGKNILMVFDTINCALVTRVAIQNLSINNISENHEN